MPNYRRFLVPGATYFFTLVTECRAPLFEQERARCLLGEAIRECRRRWPFRVPAIVLLPDHLHCVWSLPGGDDRYPQRWSWIKRRFVNGWLAGGGDEQATTPGRRNERRRGVLQPKYWEHMIRDEHDLERHADYIHYNPVRHGLVRCPRDWPFSSFPRAVLSGDYPDDWGCGEKGTSPEAFSFADLDTTAME